MNQNKNISPDLVSIGSYLEEVKESPFMIPPYQRAYSWGIEECQALLEDIETFKDSSQEHYFFGTIIITENEGKSALIDGQQRTITFLLLLKALQLKLDKLLKNRDNSPSLEPYYKNLGKHSDRIDGIFYRTGDFEKIANIKSNNTKVCIIENLSINEEYKEDFSKIISSNSLEEAEKKIKPKDKRRKYSNFFKNFKLFYDELEKKDNTLIKTFADNLLDKCQVIRIKSWVEEQAITMFNSLNAKGQPLDDTDIISAALYAKYDKDKSDREEFKNLWQEIKERTKTLETTIKVDLKAILQQLMYISRAESKVYEVRTPGLRDYYMHKNKGLLNKPIELCSNLLSIIKIWEKISEYAAVCLLLQLNNNSKLFLISYLYRYKDEAESLTEERVSTFAEGLLRLFTVLEVVETSYSSKEFKQFLFKENLRFVDKEVSEAELIEDLNKHIHATWKRENLEQQLKDYTKDKLIFLNDYLYAIAKGEPLKLDHSIDIEHIMPKSAKNKEHTMKDAKMDSKEEFHDYLNKIGNKILLENSLNRYIGNTNFSTKKTYYQKSIFPLAKALSNYPHDSWTKEDIDKTTDFIIRKTKRSLITKRSVHFFTNKSKEKTKRSVHINKTKRILECHIV